MFFRYFFFVCCEYVLERFSKGLVKFILLDDFMCLNNGQKRSKGRISSEPRKGKSKIMGLVKV